MTGPLAIRWGSGEPAFGAWLSIPSAFSAELVARQGFDYICIDLQHGIIDYQVAVTMLQAISTSDAVPLVRVPSNEFAAINRVLDAGALGVIVPMVNSADEASKAVRACRYPPQGERSFGPSRAAFSCGPDYFAHANERITCIPMLETCEALDNIDEILCVPGIDAIYVGPNDLSISLGQGPGLHNEGAYRSAYTKIVEACAACGVVAGIHSNAELAATHVANGFQLITVSSDVGSLATGSVGDLARARGN